jgi:hypothetical protein
MISRRSTYSSCLWSLAYRKPRALDEHDDAHNAADETHVVEEHTQLARVRAAAKKTQRLE